MAKAKVVRINYTTLRDQPDTKAIEKTIAKWVSKGYELQSQIEQPLGLSKVFRLSNPFHRGHTQLTFIKK